MHFIYIVVFHSLTYAMYNLEPISHSYTHSSTYTLIHIHTYTHTTKPNNTRAVLIKYILKKLEQLREETNDHTLRIMSVT